MSAVIVTADEFALRTLASRINDATAAAEAGARSAVEGAITAGTLLIEAKRQIKHGQWENWINANCKVAPRTARAFMALATKLQALPIAERQRVADLPVRDAIRAITTSADAPPRQPRSYFVPKEVHERVSAEIKRACDRARAAARTPFVDRRAVESARAQLRRALEALDQLEAGRADDRSKGSAA